MANTTTDALSYVGLLAACVIAPLVWRFVAKRQRARGTWAIFAHLLGSVLAFWSFFVAFAVFHMRDGFSVLMAFFVGGLVFLATLKKKSSPAQPFQPRTDAAPPQNFPDVPTLPPPEFSGTPDELPGPLCEIEFDYENASGAESHRTVEVYAVDEAYFEGFCHKALETRTFAISRVIGKVVVHDTGEVLSAWKWAAQASSDARNPGVVDIGRDDRHQSADPYEPEDSGIEILFTGFSRSQRQDLEEMAEAAGMIVRKSVTKGLTYLCIGSNAGPSKMAQATDAGACIIELDGFLDLLKS